MLNKDIWRRIFSVIVLFGFLYMLPTTMILKAESLMSISFEENDLLVFEARLGTEHLELSDHTAKSGKKSLLVTHRQGTAFGPTVDVTSYIDDTSTLEVSVWVKLKENQEAVELLLSSEEQYINDDVVYNNLSQPVKVTDQDWVELTGVYIPHSEVEHVKVYIEEPYDDAVERASDFYLDDFSIAKNEQQSQELLPSVEEAYRDYFFIGAAITPQQQSGRHGDVLKEHYNMIVAENIMKLDAIQPVEGAFNFEVADQMIEKAKANGMMVRFHTLVWHSQTADWMFKDKNGEPMVVDGEVKDPDHYEENRQLLLDRIETHIRTVVSRYAHDIDSWDVVNEVIEGNGYRNSIYYIMTGDAFIRHAFQVTRDELNKHGAKGKLYYNDYGTDDPKKRELIYDMVEDMIDKGIPIDGIGHQTHISINHPNPDLIRASIEKFSELGLDNQITELDVSIYHSDQQAGYGDYRNIPNQILYDQAIRYRELFDLFISLSDDISCVVFWGIGDDHTWLDNFPVPGRKNAPFIFDRELQAKLSYYSIMASTYPEFESVMTSAENALIEEQESDDTEEGVVTRDDSSLVTEDEETDITQTVNTETEETPIVWWLLGCVIMAISISMIFLWYKYKKAS